MIVIKMSFKYITNIYCIITQTSKKNIIFMEGFNVLSLLLKSPLLLELHDDANFWHRTKGRSGGQTDGQGQICTPQQVVGTLIKNKKAV